MDPERPARVLLTDSNSRSTTIYEERGDCDKKQKSEDKSDSYFDEDSDDRYSEFRDMYKADIATEKRIESLQNQQVKREENH